MQFVSSICFDRNLILCWDKSDVEGRSALVLLVAKTHAQFAGPSEVVWNMSLSFHSLISFFEFLIFSSSLVVNSRQYIRKSFKGILSCVWLSVYDAIKLSNSSPLSLIFPPFFLPIDSHNRDVYSFHPVPPPHHHSTRCISLCLLSAGDYIYDEWWCCVYFKWRWWQILWDSIKKKKLLTSNHFLILDWIQ